VIVARSASRSDPGRKRRRNEDSFVCEPPLFAVADGMGGAQAGEVASGLAAAALRERKENGGGVGSTETPGSGGAGSPSPGAGAGSGEAHVAELIQAANRRVWQRANEDAAASGMGTTITVALVEPEGRVLFGHVGDSRAYLLRAGRLEQLTEDHSLVAELVRRGELSPEEAETHPQRSVITRALGTDPDVDVDTFPVEGKAGDVFLLCSDGLSSMIDDETVLAVLSRHHDDLDAAAKALVAAANRGGGEDNITAVLFELGAGAEVGGDTTPMAAVAESEPEEPAHDEDEDTLEGIRSPVAEDTARRPAAVDTMVVPAEAVQPAAAPQAPGLARRLLALLVILTLVLVIAALVLWGLAR
jgi:protein phosphatase